jgi:hypothetical protein
MFKKLVSILVVIVFSLPAYGLIGTTKLTNNSGEVAYQYDPVIIDSSSDLAFTLTNVSRAGSFVGIVNETSIANSATGIIVTDGIIDVDCTGLVTRGDWLVTSTTKGKAASGGTVDPSGAFGIALETGTNVNIMTYLVIPNPLGSGGVVSIMEITSATDLILTIDDDDTDASNTMIIRDGAANTLATFTDAGTTGDLLVTGYVMLLDDKYLKVGTGLDIWYGYDEAGDNRAEWTDGTNLLMSLKDNGTKGNVIITGTLDVGNFSADEISGVGGTFTGILTLGTGPTTVSNTAGKILFAALADAANIGRLDHSEILASDWVNTAHPWTNNEVSNTLTASLFVGSGSTTNAIDLATAEVAGTLPDGNISDTLTASIFKGSGTTTNAIDLATAEVAGELPDGNVSNTLTASLFVGSGSSTNAIDLATAEIAGTLAKANVEDGAYFIDSAGDDGQVWTSDGSGAGVWEPGGTDYTVTTRFYDDFIGSEFLGNWIEVATGTGGIDIIDGGVAHLHCGTNFIATGGLDLGTTSIGYVRLELDAKIRFRMFIESDISGNGPVMRIGVCDDASLHGSTESAWFQAHYNEDGGQWSCNSRDSSVSQQTETNIDEDAWHDFEIHLNDLGTDSVTFYIDGNLVATHETRVPSPTNNLFFRVVNGQTGNPTGDDIHAQLDFVEITQDRE